MRDLIKTWTVRSAEAFEPRGLALAIGRSLLAFAELTVLLANPDSILFGSVPTGPPSELCQGVGSISLWCIATSGSQPHAMASPLAIIILATVIVGFQPRWLCIPHWYVAFSIAVRTTAIDGGDRAAQILTLLLIPICLGDRRTWHWHRIPTPLPLNWRGAAYAAHVLLRCQIAVIYLEAAVSKLSTSSWRHGTALPIILNDPYFGLPHALRPIAGHVLGSQWVGASATWSVIALEVFICLSMAFGARVRRWALYCGICLHVMIILAMGLFSFGLTMIALLMVASVRDPSKDLDNHALGGRLEPSAAAAASVGTATAHPVRP
jgi:antimicrobial peptide system SdpB family protein